MMKLIGIVILIFILISIGPALLKSFFNSLNPFDWLMTANKKTVTQVIDYETHCLQNMAKQTGVLPTVQSRCAGKIGAAYTGCLRDVLSAEAPGKDWSMYCAGNTVQKAVTTAPKNVAIQKACTYVPGVVPNWFKRLIGLGDCVSQPG